MNKKNYFLGMAIAVVIASVAIVNSGLDRNGRAANDVTLSTIEALAQAESGNFECTSGGVGRSKCAVITGNESCTVECVLGYYACCNATIRQCQCRPIIYPF